MNEQPLLTPVRLGRYQLSNRIVMAPMTRSRADNPDNAPTELHAQYYAQRASAGLIITEGSQISPQAVGYIHTPGIHTPAQIAGWRKVSDAVHAGNGRIFLQLWHVGYVSHPDFHGGALPVAPSAINPNTQSYTPQGMKDTVTPRALETHEVKLIVQDYAQAAKNAIAAGLDGVEIHGANGYLLYQFIHPSTNLRTDDFGGSAENNVRFAKLVCRRVREAIGRDKIITLRLSQDGVDDFTGAWPGVSYARALGRALADVDADALHWASFSWNTNRAEDEKTPMPVALRAESGKPMIVNGGIAEAADVEAAIAAGAGELLAVGRPLFAQPDWPYIIRSGAAYEWAPFDRKYVIRPAYDYSYDYPHDLPRDDWDPDLKKRRPKHWLA